MADGLPLQGLLDGAGSDGKKTVKDLPERPGAEPDAVEVAPVVHQLGQNGKSEISILFRPEKANKDTRREKFRIYRLFNLT